MRSMKKFVSFIAAAALTLTALPMDGISLEVQAADTPDTVVKLQPGQASTFNDTDGDGLGEFEGWGTSLCWWANRIGYSETLTSEAARLFFSDEGLDMNIGRYNVGGGDDVGDVTVEEIPANENAQFYGISGASYTGKSMKEESLTAFAGSTYAVSDADFGFAKGETVGDLTYIGWINEVGTEDDAAADGGNLHYTVSVDETASYTVKIILTLSGTNERAAAIRVNGDSDQTYVVDAATINNNVIASTSNQKLFLATFSDVALNAGDNTIDIGGYGDWTLDFVKMAVIKSGEEGVLPETDEFLHAEHIVRSDAGVPGYAVDVTKIDTSKKSIEEYEAEFARVDEECGYAWNYDWDADKNQINVLKAAAAASGEDFIAEAFSNSPPYFMTVSGCSSGNTDSGRDNLRADSVNAFAAYMADVIEHWNNEGIITFQSTTAMNEPYTNYWGAYSNKQEGCHFDQGESQSRIIVALNKELEKKGIDIIISASDETSIDTAISSWNALSDEAKAAVDRIDTHTYSGSDRAGLKETAEEAERNLWMSEVDGAYTAGTNAGEMSAALGLAQRMMTDVNGLQSSAWILWNAIDMHADSSEYGQSWVNKGSNNDYLSMEDLEAAWKSRTSNGYWGLAAADHDNEEIVLSMKYYAYGQFSRYIRPGYTIIGTNKSGTTLAAYDPEGEKAVIVAMNTSDSDKVWKFDLSGFENISDDITAIRTSGSMDDGEKWADVTASDNITADTENNSFTASMKANSITTYIIEGVSGIKPASETDNPKVTQVEVSKDQVTGTTPWNNSSNVASNVVDGNYETFFDGVTDGYVIIDLQEATEIAAVSWAPRGGYADRCVGATISGSNDGETWTDLYTIEETPAVGRDTFAYCTEFKTTEHTWRYVKYWVSGDGSNCNLSELKIWKLAPTIESQADVSASTYNGVEPKLPETVEVGLDNGETKEIYVTWDLSNVDVSWAEMGLFDSVEVTGTSSEANGTLTGYIICAPDNLEYLIDCTTGDSGVTLSQKETSWPSAAWAAAKGLDGFLNTDSSDQKKTDDNTWGYTFDEAKMNVWDYAMGNDLYGFGYWAGSNEAISYELTLPAGKHEVMLGCFDFWNGRTMNVYYAVGDGEKQELCTLTSNHSTGSSAGGTISLDADAVVTISVENGGDGDPVLSWISVNGASASVEAVTGVGYTDGTTGLPKTVTVTESNGTEKEANVTWNVSKDDLNVDPFTDVAVTGTVEGYPGVTATATVKVFPANIEYMIDCDNVDSPTWDLVKDAETMLNTEAADQAKTDENTWGYTSVLDTDIASKGNITDDADPYAHGWYAKSGKNVTYQVTLPAGEHTILLGAKEWWGQTRPMTAYYSVNGGDETKLFDLNLTSGKTVYAASDAITLEEESVITITVKKSGSQDPVLSWIMVSGTGKADESIIADFDFDDEISGFTGGKAVATVAGGDIELVDNGENGKAAKFVKSESDWLNVTALDGSSLLTGYDEITVSYDIMPDSSGTSWVYYAAPDDTMLTWGTNGNQERYLGVLVKDGTTEIERYNNTGSRPAKPTIAMTAGEWQHVDIVYTTDCTVAYLNGTKVAKVDSSYQLTDILGTDSIFQIGKGNWAPGEYSTMLLDNFKIVEGTKLYDDEEPQTPEQLAEQLTLPYTEVYGNITLPETIGKAAVTWATDHAEIVDVESHEVEGYDDMPAGVVTRPEEDTEVTMTATIELEGQSVTKDFTFIVKAAPEAIEESDYTDYFFAYFAGEGYADGEQIYFASSQDGLNWDDLNNNNPVLTSTLGEEGVRDPFIIRSPEGDKFYLIATDLKIYGNGDWNAAQNSGSQSLMVWESTDLVNWSDQRMVEVSAEIGAGCTWAPEATYDPITGEYVVYWASRTPSVDTKQRVYYAKTRDFYTFTEPQLYIEKDQSSIDTTMIEYNGTYYRYTKNEGGSTNELGALTKTIFIETGDSVLGEFTSIFSDSLNANQWVEGPTIFKLNDDDAEEDTWCLLVDEFGGRGYYPLLTTDLGSGEFTSPESGTYQMPSRARHGTPIRITADEYAAVMAAYGSPEEVNTATIAGQTPELPDTVTVGGTQKAVTWNLDGVSFDGDVYSVVEVTGTVEGSAVPAVANVQIIPADVEYMIDCNNLDSQTWKNAAAISSGLKNTAAADQAKTEENTWGYISTVGSEDGYDMTSYSQNDVSNPYAGGWWARGGKNIAYQVTLPAGEHTIMLGCTGWWNMDRQMDVYYSVNGGEETKLCDFDAVKSSEISSGGTITLEEEAVVTITVKKAAGSDPILSWITVCGTAEEPPVVIDYTGLIEQIEAAEALNADDYTTGSYADVADALADAKAVLNNAETQEEADAAADALKDAIAALVHVADFTALRTYYEEHKDITGDYTAESYEAYVTARNAAEAVLANRDASQEEVDAALADLQAAVEGLVESEVVDKSALEELYDTYKDTEQGNYTDDSYEALQSALEGAKAVLDDTEASQAEVNAAYDALQAAYENLQEKETPTPVVVDKTKLQKLYDEYVNTAQGDYTDDSYEALRSALEAAKAVLDNEDATQEEVSEAYSVLYDAVKGLTDKSSGGTSDPGTDKPDKTDKTDKTDKADKTGKGAAKTGDAAPVAALAVIALAAVLTAIITFRRRMSRS